MHYIENNTLEEHINIKLSILRCDFKINLNESEINRIKSQKSCSAVDAVSKRIILEHFEKEDE